MTLDGKDDHSWKSLLRSFSLFPSVSEPAFSSGWSFSAKVLFPDSLPPVQPSLYVTLCTDMPSTSRRQLSGECGLPLYLVSWHLFSAFIRDPGMQMPEIWWCSIERGWFPCFDNRESEWGNGEVKKTITDNSPPKTTMASEYRWDSRGRYRKPLLFYLGKTSTKSILMSRFRYCHLKKRIFHEKTLFSVEIICYNVLDA